MATNYASATYTEIIDLQTIPDSVSIIGVHTPQGTAPYERLKGFFTQFRKYRYDGASLTMIPAANLPVDPLGLTGVVGTTDLMDPRDALNPILAHGCHGETLEGSLNMIYTNQYITKSDASGATVQISDVNTPATIQNNTEVADSAIKLDVDISRDLDLYYEKLTDRTWKKFGIQSPIRLNNLHPLVHRVVQNAPTLPFYDAASSINDENAGLIAPIQPSTAKSVINSSIYGSDWAGIPAGELNQVGGWVGDISVSTNTYKQQFTNKMERLGWLPTSMPDGTYNALTMLPKCFMQVLIMPPAYNVTQFFRCAIKHRFSFSGFTSSLDLMAPNPQVPAEKNPPYHNWIDYGSSLDSIGAKSEVISDGVA